MSERMAEIQNDTSECCMSVFHFSFNLASSKINVKFQGLFFDIHFLHNKKHASVKLVT